MIEAILLNSGAGRVRLRSLQFGRHTTTDSDRRVDFEFPVDPDKTLVFINTISFQQNTRYPSVGAVDSLGFELYKNNYTGSSVENWIAFELDGPCTVHRGQINMSSTEATVSTVVADANPGSTFYVNTYSGFTGGSSRDQLALGVSSADVIIESEVSVRIRRPVAGVSGSGDAPFQLLEIFQ